jgi:hypothetical protein
LVGRATREIANMVWSVAAISQRTAAAMAEVAATTEHGNDRTIRLSSPRISFYREA